MKTKNLINTFLALQIGLAILLGLSLPLYLNATTGQIEPNKAIIEGQNRLPINHEANLKQRIANLASEHGISAKTALRIADCESKTGQQLFNKESSAKGIYQFTDRTWEHYCDGNVLNTNDNIHCFMDLYKQHPGWWKCS